MTQNNFKSWRAYFYIAFGIGFGIYRGSKVIEWGTWEYFDLVLAVGMVSIGVYIIMKRSD